MPGCPISGSLTRNNETVEINPEFSHTWYERQWIYGEMSLNWTWFGLPLNGDDECPRKDISLWVWNDKATGHRQFATVQTEPGEHEVEVVTPFKTFDQNWRSNATGAY